MPLWAAAQGLVILFDVNTASLRQAIVPNQMLSRVLSIAGNVGLVYGVIGAIVIGIVAFFGFFTPLGDAQRYVDERQAEAERISAEAEAATA